MSEELVEKVARAIFDADNGLDGDCVGDMIYENFRIEGADVAANQEQTMIVCRQAARAAIAAWNSRATPNNDLPTGNDGGRG